MPCGAGAFLPLVTSRFGRETAAEDAAAAAVPRGAAERAGSRRDPRAPAEEKGDGFGGGSEFGCRARQRSRRAPGEVRRRLPTRHLPPAVVVTSHVHRKLPSNPRGRKGPPLISAVRSVLAQEQGGGSDGGSNPRTDSRTISSSGMDERNIQEGWTNGGRCDLGEAFHVVRRRGRRNRSAPAAPYESTIPVWPPVLASKPTHPRMVFM